MQISLKRFQRKSKAIDNFSELGTLLSDLCNEFCLIDFLNNKLEDLGKNKDLPDLKGDGYFVLLDENKYILSLIYQKKVSLDNKGVIVSYPSDNFISSLTPEHQLNYTIYGQKSNLKHNRLDKSQFLTIKKESKLKYKDVIFLEAFNDVLKIDKDKNWFCLFLTSKKALPYRWEYDLNTLQPKKIITSDILTPRIEVTLRILSDIGDQNCVKNVIELCGNENHTIRWEAVNTLINLDFEKGIKTLRYMKKHDKNAEIVEAATKSLNKLCEL